MSLLSRIFGGGLSKYEREILDLYAAMLCTFAGFTRKQAEQAVSEAIEMCKRQGMEDGTADLPPDFGDRMLLAASLGEGKSRELVEKSQREGATEADIREWWNMPDVGRRMIVWSENLFRLSVFRNAQDEDGMSDTEAAAIVHKMFPLYGDPADTSKFSGENRPLPHELRGRIDCFKEMHGAELIMEKVKQFSSFNAFVRDGIRRGFI